MSIPNLPYADCPVGADEDANPELRVWGEKPDIAEPLDHVALAEKHGLISFEDGTRITGSGYVVYRGQGARLERALIQLLLDTHTQDHGYEEVNVPHIIKRECMEGTGQLPKFEDDMYGLEDNSLFLAPTAEVPVTNLYRDTLLKEDAISTLINSFLISLSIDALLCLLFSLADFFNFCSFFSYFSVSSLFLNTFLLNALS